MDLADFTLTTFDQSLGTLDHLLGKAAASEQGEALLTARLAPDMHPLATQVRFTTSQAYNVLNRLYGDDHKSLDSDHATFAEARAHVAEVRALIATARARTAAADDATVEFTLPNGMAFALSAAEYVRDWALPQFYFHLTAAYAILRHAGLPVGKIDYVGYMARHAKR